MFTCPRFCSQLVPDSLVWVGPYTECSLFNFGEQTYAEYTPRQLLDMGKTQFCNVLCAYEEEVVVVVVVQVLVVVVRGCLPPPPAAARRRRRPPVSIYANSRSSTPWWLYW